uniref:NAC domain-containing protein n=1 Tax=Strongyloides venezuelensis TaxID=75913 RepID=A0A0K0FSW9_STRVS
MYADLPQVFFLVSCSNFSPNGFYQHGATLPIPINDGNLYVSPPQVDFINNGGIISENVGIGPQECVSVPATINNENMYINPSQVDAMNPCTSRNAISLPRSSNSNVDNDIDLFDDISFPRSCGLNVDNNADLLDFI